MGTRSTVTFIGKTGNKETPYVKVYQQYDGFIVDGIGWELARFLKKMKIINGITNFNLNQCEANGIGCLAAQYITLNKVEIGGLYIEPLDSDDKYVDYNYKVIIDEDKVPNFADEITTIEVTNFGEDKLIFKGSPSELLKFRDDEDEEEEQTIMTPEEAENLKLECEIYISNNIGKECKLFFDPVYRGIKVNTPDSYFIIDKEFKELEYFEFTGSFSAFKDTVDFILEAIQEYIEDFKLLYWNYERLEDGE